MLPRSGHVMYQTRKPPSSPSLGRLGTHGMSPWEGTRFCYVSPPPGEDPALQGKPGALAAGPPYHPILSLEVGEHFPTRDTNSSA